MRSLLIASGLALVVGFAAVPSHADDLDDCLAGLQRYQAYFPQLQQARAQCNAHYERIRMDPALSEEEKELQLQSKCPMKQGVCQAIYPEQAHLGCENYLQYGNGGDAAAAASANAVLKPIYDECEAQ
jgi:hypothetical protein